MTDARAADLDFGERFEVRKEIGRGAMGVVYDVSDEQLGRRVALKTLPTLSADEQRFLNHEFRLLRDVRHPNVVGLHELFGDARGRAWFTMELIEGTHFPEAFAARTAAGDDASLRAMVLQVAEAIEAIHATGTVHRDIKPTNIMVGRDGNAKVLDFGLADTRRRLTLDARTTGTLAYLAPEALWGEASEASDWYSFGAVLHEAVSGAPPGALVGRAPSQDEISRAIPASAPTWLQDVIFGLLRPEPGERIRLPGIAERLRVTGNRARRARAFVGRRAELDALREALAEVRGSGATRVVSIVGEPGIGKSRLLERFLGTLPRQGEELVLAGKCHHTEHIPYRGLDPVLNDLDLVLRGRAGQEPRHRALLERWQEVMRRGVALDATTQVLTEHRRSLVDTLREIVNELSSDRVILMILDDVQWGDRESGELLLELLRDRPRALVALAQRREEEESPFLAELASHPLWTQRDVIDLAPLPASEAAELTALLAPGLDEAACRAVTGNAGGLPFALESWAIATRTGQIPSSFDALLGARVDHLPEGSRGLLALVAIDPEPLPRGVALEAAGVGGDGFVALRELEALGLLRLLPGEAQIGLYHELLREGLLAEIPGSRRRALHDRVADVLREHHPEDLPRRMHHLAGAERLEEAAAVALDAAQRAHGSLAFVREATFLSRAAGWVGDAARRLELLERAAEAWNASGRASAAGDSFTAAASAAEELGRPAIDVRRLRREAAAALVSAGRVDEGEAIFASLMRERGLSFPTRSSVALAHGMWHRLTTEVRGFRDPREVSEELGEELALLQLCGARLTVSRMHTGFAVSGHFYSRAMREGSATHQAHAIISEAPFMASLGGRWERRAKSLLDRLEWLHREHSLPPLLTPHQAHGTVWWQLGQWRRSANANEAAGAILRREAAWDTIRLLVADSFGCSARAFMGDFDTLGDRVEVALQAALDRGERNAHVLLDAGDTGVRYFVRGDAEGADALAARVWDLVPEDAGVFEYAAATHEARNLLYQRRYGDAVERLEAALPRLKRNQAVTIRVARAVTYDLLARALLGVGRERSLAEVDRRLRRAIRVVEKTSIAPGIAWAARARAARWRLAGDDARADASYRDARRLFEEAEMRLFAWAAAHAAGEGAPPPVEVGDPPALLSMLDPLV